MPRLGHFLRNNIINIKLVEKRILAILTIVAAVVILATRYTIIFKY